MSLQSTACRPTAAPANPAPRLPGSHPNPAHYLAHGRLYRAIVLLPDAMCESDRPLQERWVFFDCPAATHPGFHLEALLSLAWNISTTGWCERGVVYDIKEASDLIAQGDANDDTALFERSFGPEGTEHVSPHDVDYFCTPRVRSRLELALLHARVGPALEIRRSTGPRLSIDELLAMRVLRAYPGQRTLIVKARQPNKTKSTAIRVDADQYQAARCAKAAKAEHEGGAA